MSGKAKPKSRSQAARQAQKRDQAAAARTSPTEWQNPLAQQQPLVGGRWLLYAILGVVALAGVCAYLTLCLLFYQGQWQIVFHPSRSITSTPATVGVKYDDVRFDFTGTGQPQLAGWWIPAESGAGYAGRTLLFLHDGRGSLSDVTAQLKTLHSLGINIFAFDYRGFGQSADFHPSEDHVYEDADAAWNYLTDIRHIDQKSIVIYGAGLGATIATETAIRHPESSALVLENPAPPALSLIAADSRTSILPIRWLFRDRFEIGPKLRTLRVELRESTEKIVLSGETWPSHIIVRDENQNRSGPKLLLFLGPAPPDDPRYLVILNDFLSSF
jgi:uncharacterized protein